MKCTTITIGGGNKNFLFTKFCLELLIINCLKNKKIKKHIHIGRLAKQRILFINLLLLFLGISRSRFEYKNQVKSLDFLSNYKGSIVISSAPIIGGLSILKCWKFKLPVLIFDNKFYYLNFSTFLKNEKLVWRDINELSVKLNHLITNYEKYSNEYYEHYKFLKGNNKLSNDFLLENSKRKYNEYYRKNSIYNKPKILKIIPTFIFKYPYLFTKFLLLLFFIYIKPFVINKLESSKKLYRRIRRILISKNLIKKFNILKLYTFILVSKLKPKLVVSYKIFSLKDIRGRKFLVSNKSKSTISPPNFYKKEVISGEYEKTFAILTENVKFNPYCSSLIVDNNIYIDSLVFKKPYKYGLVKGGLLVRDYSFLDDISLSKKSSFRDLKVINPSLNKKRIKKTKTIDKAILIGGDGAANWYHWIIECLPKLFFTTSLPDEFDSYPLVVPDICKKNKIFNDTLKLFNNKKRDILYFGIEDIIFANKLIFIEDLLKSPISLKFGYKLTTSDYSQNDEAILNYSSQLQKYYEGEKSKVDSNFHKKVFLARKQTSRKYNQDELIEIISKYEFTIIYLEDLEFLEQISIFSNAKYIVGPPGAAWTGLIFSRKNKLKCLSWLPEYFDNACNYSNLANLLNHDLKFMSIDKRYNDDKYFDFHEDYCILNPILFEKEIKKLISN